MSEYGTVEVLHAVKREIEKTNKLLEILIAKISELEVK